MKTKRFAFPLLLSSLMFLSLLVGSTAFAVEEPTPSVGYTETGVGFSTIVDDKPVPPPTKWDPTIPSGEQPISNRYGKSIPEISNKRLPATGEQIQRLFMQLGYLTLLVVLLCLLWKWKEEGEEHESKNAANIT